MANKRKRNAQSKSNKKQKLVEEAVVEKEPSPEPQLEDVQPVSLPGKWTNKQKVLIFCSRGVSYKGRHFVKDLLNLMPHAKTDVKLDKKCNLLMVNEICEMKTCNKCIYLECRKKRDLYMWVANSPHGPSALFNVENLNMMEELKFMGNCLKSSRPVLSFDSSFDEEPHLQLLKELFTQVFGTPRYHPKSQPFVDHVLNFTYLDGRIWFRNYQISEENGDLVEIGPRFTLALSRIFSGSFGGPVLYVNENYQSPNLVRRNQRKAGDEKYISKVLAKNSRQQRKSDHTFHRDSTEAVFQSIE